MNEKITIGILLFVFCFQSQLCGSVFNVTSENDSGTGTLREAIINANTTVGHDTITVAHQVDMINLSTIVSNSSGTFLDFIQDTLTLFGNNVILDTDTLGRFLVIGKNVIIKDVTFRNARSKEFGAVIFYNADQSTFINCKFINNAALTNPILNYSLGGVIHMGSGNLILRDCEFISNSSDHDAGVISIRNGIVDLHNCSFVNNSAGRRGQSIYQNLGGVINIYSSNFSSTNSKSDIYFSDGSLIFQAGYSLPIGSTIWVEN